MGDSGTKRATGVALFWFGRRCSWEGRKHRALVSDSGEEGFEIIPLRAGSSVPGCVVESETRNTKRSIIG